MSSFKYDGRSNGEEASVNMEARGAIADDDNGSVSLTKEPAQNSHLATRVQSMGTEDFKMPAHTIKF